MLFRFLKRIAGSPDRAAITVPSERRYHDFSWIGLKTGHQSEKFAANQDAKARVICAYLLLAMAKCRDTGDSEVSVAELFCADGFYAMFARRFGADRVVGYDNDRDGYLANAMALRDAMAMDRVEFVRTDVESISDEERFSIVANVGGIYHTSEPRAVIEKSYAMARRFLILQNVVSMATSADDYLARPAPGWTWGNRFSRQSFDRLIRDLGYKVIDQSFNELTGNARPEDRGSVYYLIEK
jgi:predicted RNA methylase